MSIMLSTKSGALKKKNEKLGHLGEICENLKKKKRYTRIKSSSRKDAPRNASIAHGRFSMIRKSRNPSYSLGDMNA